MRSLVQLLVQHLSAGLKEVTPTKGEDCRILTNAERPVMGISEYLPLAISVVSNDLMPEKVENERGLHYRRIKFHSRTTGLSHGLKLGIRNRISRTQ